MLSCVKGSQDEVVEADEGWYSRGCSEVRGERGEVRHNSITILGEAGVVPGTRPG